MSDLFKGLKNIIPDITAEAKRLAIQGQMEIASGLFGHSAFVPYGPGQYTATPEAEKSQGQEGAAPQRENDGMER